MKKSVLFLLLCGISNLGYSQLFTHLKDVKSLTFIPDYTVTGSGIEKFKTLGKADWKMRDGEIVGTVNSGNSGGMIFLDKQYQDLAFQASIKNLGKVETGLIFRIEKNGDRINGVLVSIKNGEVVPYSITFDSQGKEVERVRLRYAGGIRYRIAPAESGENNPVIQVNVGPTSSPSPLELPIYKPNTDFIIGEWNQIEIFLEVNVIRSFLNNAREVGGAIDGERALSGYGPMALYIAGPGEVHFKNIMSNDISIRENPTEVSSLRFKVQRISDMYYSWGADAADFNKDGHMDVVAGPYIYFGPDFTKHKEIFPAIAVSPSKEFTSTNTQFSYDFNKDGWPDILTSPSSAVLFINPKGESRRWESFKILPAVQSEITDFIDVDGDGIPELVYGADGSLRYAKPYEDDPTKPWQEFQVSEKGFSLAHGIGTGDINNDGRLDIINPFGWWEQPTELGSMKLWKHHPESFGHYGRSLGVGGSLMAVYDVNGNGLNDVVTTLNAHGFGLAWFEQKRDQNGAISFVKHMISDDYLTDNAGGVTFSQAHGATMADIDQDGIPDFIVGKRYFTHLDNQFDPDSYGPPVIYWYKTVRNPNVPGGAEFIPELIHNRSGAGSEITAIDLDNNGRKDIITSTNRGTFIFWNQGKQGK